MGNAGELAGAAAAVSGATGVGAVAAGPLAVAGGVAKGLDVIGEAAHWW